jgi:putative integral membrane protein (TIGR02587 family)
MNLHLKIQCNLDYAIGLMRALLGAMVFALPLLMTMEMWELGVVMEPLRLALLLGVTLPMLVALSYYAGFERTFSLVDNILDALAAMAVSALGCLIVLALFGQLGPAVTWNDAVGRLAVLSFGASIGALLADKQFNDGPEESDGASHRKEHGLFSRLFVMAIGAVFLALNVAPTDEVEIIAAAMSPLQAALLAVVSVVALHAILTGVDSEAGETVAGRFVRRTMAGYGVCLLMCGYILWSFGRTDGIAAPEVVERIVVLAFPASLGAGAARLILGARPDE